MIKWLVRHAPTVWLLVLSIIAFGSIAYISLPREAAPDVKIPVVLVTTPYVGVSPADVESLVTIPIENELAGVKDIKKLSSTSKPVSSRPCAFILSFTIWSIVSSRGLSPSTPCSSAALTCRLSSA